MLTEASSGENLAFVKDSLFKFIRSHIPNANLSVIDDIILSYVYSTFEGGSEEFYGQLNDVVADFADMMSAYFDDFHKIERNTVCDWMIDLVHCLDEMAITKANEEQGEDEARSVEHERPNAEAQAKAVAEKTKKSSRTNSTSEDEKELRQEKAFAVFYEDEEVYRKCAYLQEMFPETNPMEIKHCMSIAFGDIDVAISAIIHRRDSGQALECSAWQAAAKLQSVDDDEIKHRIIARYSYVDRESETKEHKPVAPKHEPKKMVRYRDNKIVSLKGERYTEVPKSEDEGVKKSNKKHHP